MKYFNGPEIFPFKIWKFSFLPGDSGLKIKKLKKCFKVLIKQEVKPKYKFLHIIFIRIHVYIFL